MPFFSSRQTPLNSTPVKQPSPLPQGKPSRKTRIPQKGRCLFAGCLFLLAAILFLSPISQVTAANPQPTLVSFPIPLMVENSQSGLFVDLIHTLLTKAGLEQVNLEVYPARRSVRYFLDGRAAILFPATPNTLPADQPYASTQAVYTKRDFIFTRKDQPVFRKLDDLQRLRVGLTAGYPYEPSLVNNPLLYIEYANSDESNARKLAAGRIDAFIVEENSGLRALQKTGLADDVHYDPTAPISEQAVFFACQDNPDGINLCHKLSETLKLLKTDGTLSRLFGQGEYLSLSGNSPHPRSFSDAGE